MVTPPSSANGHVPHDSQENAVNSNGVSESTGDEQTNEDTGTDTRDNVEENASNGLDNTVTTEEVTVPERNASSAQKKQVNKEESLEEGAPASDHNVSHSKVTVEEQPVDVIRSSPVGEESVPGQLPGEEVKSIEETSVSGGGEAGAGATEADLDQNKVASEVGLSGEHEVADQSNAASVRSSDQDTGVAETDLVQQRVVSEGSLSGENDTAPVADQKKRASVAASEHSAAPSDNEVNLSRQNRDSLELDPASLTTTEGPQLSQPIETSKEDSASLGGKESLSAEMITQDSVSVPAKTSEPSQPAEIAKNDSVAHDRKDSVGLPAASDDDFSVNSDIIHGRICT